jgi:hypothetical protein
MTAPSGGKGIVSALGGSSNAEDDHPVDDAARAMLEISPPTVGLVEQGISSDDLTAVVESIELRR